MTTYTILANVGNRNLSYKGQTSLDKIVLAMRENEIFANTINDIHKSFNPKSFREVTELLLDKYEAIYDDFAVNIITNTVTYTKEKLGDVSQIILFHTNTPDGRNDQDTIHSAEILKKILTSKYSIPVATKQLQCSVVEENGLLMRYCNHIRPINRELNANQKIAIVLQGGSTQMKNAMRAAAEFIIPSDVRIFLDAQEKETGESTISLLVPTHSEILNNLKIVLSQIENADYSGALQVLRQYPEKFQKIRKLIEVCSNRMGNAYDKLNQISGKAMEDTEILNFFESIINNTIYNSGNETINANIRENGNLKLVIEYLNKAEFDYLKGYYTEALLAFHQFIEVFAKYAFIKTSGLDIDNYNVNSEDITELITKLKLEQSYLQHFDPKLKDKIQIDKTTLPYKLWFLAEVDGPYKKINEIVKKYNSSTNISKPIKTGEEGMFDKIRNKLVHEGKSVDKARLDTICEKNGDKDFSTLIYNIKLEFGLTDTSNTIETMNNLAIKYVRENIGF
ncbi:MAG: hypothetical protein SGJ04_07370 [Bacteroidota bacterium]|nr:hypothetical protein [Bacteroidota bacterium]